MLAKKTGMPALVAFLNKQDMVDKEDNIQAVEAEVRQLVKEGGYTGDTTPVISGCALEAVAKVIRDPETKLGESVWFDRIHNLLQAIDQHVAIS